MKSPRQSAYPLAAISLAIVLSTIDTLTLDAAVTLTGSDAFETSVPPTGDLIVTGDLSILKGIDFGTAAAHPALSAVQINYFGAGENAAKFDLTDPLGTIQWRDNLVAAAKDKMKLDGGNLLTLYKSDGTGVGVLLDPNTGQIQLTGTGAGIYAGGNPVFTIGSSGNLVVGNRPLSLGNTTASGSSSTGALTVAGGIGVAMDSFINGIRVGRGGGNVTSNTAYGSYALQCDTTGGYNTASGYFALYGNTTGYNNTAAGAFTLYRNTTGGSNTATGYYSLYGNTTGGSNTAAGSYSLYGNTTGCDNTATGYYSLYGNTTGYYNTAAGAYTLYRNTTGGSNTAAGYCSLYGNTTGYSNTAAGYYSLHANTTGYSNTAAGCLSLYANTTGGSNTAAGYFSLYGNTTGYSNTAAGAYTLYRNTTGGSNTAAGSYSLYGNTTGYSNTAAGYYSLYGNTTGYSNTAAGYYSLYSNSTGASNTALGSYSLGCITTGSSNVAIGPYAGYCQANGSALTATNSSVYIGSNACGFSNLDQNSIVIGSGATGEGANTTVIGNSATTKTHLYGTVNASGFTVNNQPVLTPSYGQSCTLSGNAILAIGNYASATQSGAIAMGTYAQASGYDSIALGSYSTCSDTSNGSIAMTGGMTTHGYSFAAGYGMANGDLSMAVGIGVADGNSSIALGGYDYQYGNWPGNHSAGDNSVTLGGVGNQALGFSSVASGFWTKASASQALALGSLNLGSATSADSWVETDPLLELGNGNAPRSWVEPDAVNRSNAITTLKNGQTTLTNKAWKANGLAPLADPGLDTASGGEALVVEGHTRLKGKVIIEQAQGDISMGIYGP